jgi:hypothetical protein
MWISQGYVRETILRCGSGNTRCEDLFPKVYARNELTIHGRDAIFSL